MARAHINRTRVLFLLLVAACAVVSVGCGSDQPAALANPVLAPAPAGAGFVPGDFVNLPKPASAQPLDAPAETETSVTQSFTVTGLGPRDVIEFYVRELPPDGWIPQRVESLSGTTLRSNWTRGDELVEVSAFAANGFESAGPTQLDLVLQFGTPERG
jgi:hypothetical protein